MNLGREAFEIVIGRLEGEPIDRSIVSKFLAMRIPADSRTASWQNTEQFPARFTTVCCAMTPCATVGTMVAFITRNECRTQGLPLKNTFLSGE
jgi:hypothetical protein